MSYSLWDEVILKLQDTFGYKDKVFTKLKVMIVAIDYDSNDDRVRYLCYVPSYEKIPHGFSTFTIEKFHERRFGVDKKFVGDTGCFITSMLPIYKHIPAPKGEKCDHCGQWFEGVERKDGVYTCRPCTEDPYR